MRSTTLGRTFQLRTARSSTNPTAADTGWGQKRQFTKCFHGARVHETFAPDRAYEAAGDNCSCMKINFFFSLSRTCERSLANESLAGLGTVDATVLFTHRETRPRQGQGVWEQTPSHASTADTTDLHRTTPGQRSRLVFSHRNEFWQLNHHRTSEGRKTGRVGLNLPYTLPARKSKRRDNKALSFSSLIPTSDLWCDGTC